MTRKLSPGIGADVSGVIGEVSRALGRGGGHCVSVGSVSPKMNQNHTFFMQAVAWKNFCASTAVSMRKGVIACGREVCGAGC